MKMKTYLVTLAVALLVLVAGVAMAQPAGELVSGKPSDWTRAISNSGVISIRTKFRGLLTDFPDPASAWSTITIEVDGTVSPFNLLGLVLDSGVRPYQTGNILPSGEVQFMFSTRVMDIRNQDGTLGPAKDTAGQDLIPRWSDLRITKITFTRMDGSLATETFSPPMLLTGMRDSDNVSGEDSSSGGCSTGAVAGFAGLLLAPLAVLRKRD